MTTYQTGTLSLDDIKGSSGVLAQFDPADLARVYQDESAKHNANVRAMVGLLADIGVDFETKGAGTGAGKWVQASEGARMFTQKGGAPVFWQFPLDKFTFALGFTGDFMRRRGGPWFAAQLQGAFGQHALLVQTRMKMALFGATNYTVVDDMGAEEVLGKTLAVKRLLNADGYPIPMNANGTVFDGATHTHYPFLNGANPTTAYLDALIATVIEHDQGANIVINIAAADLAKYAALTAWVPLANPIIDVAALGTTSQKLDITRTDNRQVGYYNGYPVWTRTWVPAGYTFVYDGASPKPLRIRELFNGSMGVQTEGEIKLVPFTIDYSLSYFGVGVQNRLNGAIGFFAGGAVAFVDPTFTY